MTVLLGNTESRVVYKNFHLDHLDKNDMDITHDTYQRYLQYNRFVPPGEKNYFVHTMNNILPSPATATEKGLFNIFPLDLTSPLSAANSSIGVVASSPLKVELEFSPIPTVQWYMVYTFEYINSIVFPGAKNTQTVRYEHLMN